MTPGPKPRPPNLVAFEGGNSKGKTRGVLVEASLPTAPDWLLPEAKAEWKRLGPRLVDKGLLSEFDRATFAAYCQAWGTVAKLEKEAAKRRAKSKDALEGIVSTTSNGNIVHHPLQSTISKARAELLRIAVEFGLTPSARARIDTDAAKQRGGGRQGRQGGRGHFGE